ncbi:MAG: thermonuclease family protein [bacterium]
MELNKKAIFLSHPPDIIIIMNMLRLRKIFFAMLLILPIAAFAHAEEYSGRVIGVSDGDTIKILIPGGRQIKVRLAEIDAPEKSQAFGNQSKKAMSGLVYDKNARVVKINIDRYGRTVGRVYIGKLDVNAEMLKKGMAWVYTQYSTDPKFPPLERAAKKLRLGLWADTDPTPPWEYRRGGAAKKSELKLKNQKAEEKKPSFGLNPKCGTKTKCSEMNTCVEAKFFLNVCGQKKLDRDGNGVPCESICD